jgi:glycosyltransferase involved in cell wall biosynthesis
MRRVMIVTNSLTGGGAERSMNLVSNELTKLGWQVALIPINAGDPDLIAPTCEIFPLNRQWRGSFIGTLRAVTNFNRIVSSWNPDIVVLNCDLPELFGALLLRKRRLVVVEHSSLAWATRPLFGKVIRKILRMRQAVWIAVSSNLKIWPNGASPRDVIQNPLMPFPKATTRPPISSHIKRLVFVGRLSPEKQPEKIIEIGKRTNLSVEVIGDGILRSSLSEIARGAGVAVTFHGRLSDPWFLITSGDLLIVPSTSEGDGLVVVEGMRERVPLLLSDIPDFRRFGLPDRNYCHSVGDFVERVNEYKKNADSLVAPPKVSDPILQSRTPDVVGRVWEKFLESL